MGEIRFNDIENGSDYIGSDGRRIYYIHMDLIRKMSWNERLHHLASGKNIFVSEEISPARAIGFSFQGACREIDPEFYEKFKVLF